MKFRSLLLICLAATLVPKIAHGFQATVAAIEPEQVSLVKQKGRVDVLLDGELFTQWDYKTYAKPIFYPIFAPDQIAMTRDWPMKADAAGESHDHPHQKSMWIGHEINGVDFWTEKEGIVQTNTVETTFADGTSNAIHSRSDWIEESNGTILLTDETVYWFGGDKTSRWINCLIDFQATRGDIVFADTKEGLFAIRTHPHLRLTADADAGVAEVYGNAINSEGDTGKEVWGKRAKWVLYFGSVDGNPVSLAMFDHPSNYRHPTTWHARDYGLIAANPFGLHYFLGKEKGAGAFKVGQGGSLQLRYRVEFFKGDVSVDLVEERFQSFAKQSLSKPKLKPASESNGSPAKIEIEK